jgi:O-antigen biosynthesis protein
MTNIAEAYQKYGLRKTIIKAYLRLLFNHKEKQINHQYQTWIKNHYPKPSNLKQQAHAQLRFKPLVSIITPVYNPKPKYLRECLNSVLEQSYSNWQLCLVDDASTNPLIRQIIREYAIKEKRIKYLFRKLNGHICQASNDALKLAKGQYVGLLDHDDVLWPNALFKVVELLNKQPQAQFIYSDEDKIELNAKRHVNPFFKPDWSPHYLRCINYITHFAVIKKSLITKVNGFRTGYEGAQDWDLFLRITSLLQKQGNTHPLNPKNPIQHIPSILYSWRKSASSTASEKHIDTAKTYVHVSQAKALTSDLKQRHITAKIQPTQFYGLWQTKYELKRKPLVSIIIPTKNRLNYIQACLNSIISQSSYKNYEIVLLDTGSNDQQVFNLYKQYQAKNISLRIFRWDKQFNFSAVNNWAAQQSRGEQLLFLNNDTQVLTEDWLERLLEYSQQEQIGAVGAKLVYANNRLQHAGVVLGLAGVANHPGHNYPDQLPTGFPVVYGKDALRNVTAVTGACLMIKKSLFFKVNGFNIKYRIAYNDIDLCLRLLKKGLFNVYQPFAKLIHHENISVGKINSQTRNQAEFLKENQLMRKHWGKLLNNDPFYNPNLSKDKLDLSLDI